MKQTRLLKNLGNKQKQSPGGFETSKHTENLLWIKKSVKIFKRAFSWKISAPPMLDSGQRDKINLNLSFNFLKFTGREKSRYEIVGSSYRISI